MSRYLALLKRWTYLLAVGMWRFECAVQIRDEHGLRVIGSGKPTGEIGVYRNYRIWWERRAQPQPEKP